MSESLPDPRLQSLINKLRPGPVRSVTVAGFDGADVLVLLGESGEEDSEVGRIPQHEVSIRRTDHPSEVFKVGQRIEAEEIGRWAGQLNLSARACENPELRAFLVAIQPGQIVSGTVSGVHNFGVFVHLDGEPQGLCTGFIGFLRGYSALQGGEETDSCGAGQRAGIRRRGGSQCSDPQV
ncbi:hypothetical protein [Streptomyces canus]|uniref:hypothetical protein n=1 Tax=Streptomyces canus TaxID=58343 RepID=UPI00371522F1